MDNPSTYFKKALKFLDDAEYNFVGGRYNTSINRSYYAVFYAAKALLFKKGIDAKKHSGVIQLFGKEYVATNKFDRSTSKILTELQESRGLVLTTMLSSIQPKFLLNWTLKMQKNS